MADSAGNVYNISDAHASDSSDGVTVNLSSAYMNVALGSGGTITVTATGAGGGCTAYDVSSFASSGWLDQAIGHDNGFAASQTTGATPVTSHQPNVNFAIFGGGSTCATPTWPSGTAGLDTALYANRCMETGWGEVTATGAQAITITASGGDDMAGSIASYKEGGAGANQAAAIYQRQQRDV